VPRPERREALGWELVTTLLVVAHDGHEFDVHEREAILTVLHGFIGALTLADRRRLARRSRSS
jgi:hypothetical protein